MPHKARSTRDQLMRDTDRAEERLDQVLVCLQRLDVRAAERSPYIEKQLPLLVAATAELQKALRAFREGL